MTKIEILQNTKIKLEKLKSPSISFGSSEYEEAYYEGWFDSKTEMLSELSKIIDELKESK